MSVRPHPRLGTCAAVSGVLSHGAHAFSRCCALAVRGAMPPLTSLAFAAVVQRSPACCMPQLLTSLPCAPRVSVDVWVTLADFCNILTTVNQSEVPLYKDPDEDLALLSLEEDRLLSGFVPLLAAPQEPCYVEKTSDKVSTRPNIPPQFLQTFILGKFSVQTEHD